MGAEWATPGGTASKIATNLRRIYAEATGGTDFAFPFPECPIVQIVHCQPTVRLTRISADARSQKKSTDVSDEIMRNIKILERDPIHSKSLRSKAQLTQSSIDAKFSQPHAPHLDPMR
jgi:hypothetical protein